MGRDLAFDLIAMVDLRAPRPEIPSNEFGVEPLAPPGNAADDDQIVKYGAAVIVGRGDGHVYLATAQHVVYLGSAERAAVPSDQPPTRVEVRFWFLPDRRFQAEALRRDEELDLAVLRVAETPELAQALERVDFHRVRPPEVLRSDDKLRTVGNPQGENPWYATPFELDLFDRLEESQLRFHTRLLMAGHSGGGLFTEDWYLVGIFCKPISHRPARRSGSTRRSSRWRHGAIRLR